MIKIDNLEVRFDVEGSDDRETFGRLFRDFIDRWSRDTDARRKRQKEADRERSLLGVSGEEGDP